MIPQPTRAQLDALRHIVDGVEGSSFVPGWKRDGSSLDTSAVPIDGHVSTAEERELRLELGRERFRGDVAEERVGYALHRLADISRKLGESQAAHEITQERLDAVAEERDAERAKTKRAERRGTLWMLGAWALFLVLVAGIAWRFSGR